MTITLKSTGKEKKMKKSYFYNHMSTNRRLVLLVLTLIISGGMVFSQQTQVKGAYGGTNGIFVYLKALVPETKDKVAYCVVERRESSSGEWKTVTTCKKPVNETEFSKQLKNAVGNMPYDASFLLKKSKLIWKKYQGSDSQDSLRLWFTMLPVQEALGIVFHDLTVKAGISYEYRILQFDDNDNTITTLLYLPAKYPGEKSKWNVPYRSYSVMSDQVTVTWSMGGTKMPPYSRVYRQERNGSNWLPVSPVIYSTSLKDSVFISATDTLVTPGAIYRYKLVPMDIFGNPGTGSESDMVAVYDFRLQAPVIEDLKSSNPDSLQGILLSWSISRNDLVNSVFIYRSIDYDKDYTKIAEVPSTASGYTDQTIEPGIKYYYQIRLTGPMGELSAPSSRIFAISDDRAKPAPPMITSAEGTSNGIRLTIMVTERNLSGVRIFRNNQDNTTMVPVTNLIPAKDHKVIWEDTSNISPVKFYGYSAKAENASHLQGTMSDTVYARSAKPVMTPEVIGLRVYKNETCNQLYWTDMHFIEAPLAGYIVYRKELPSGEMKQMNDTLISGEKNSFTDLSIVSGKGYAYSVVLVDGFGNKSAQCSPITIIPSVIPVLPPSSVFGNTEATSVKISWSIVQSATLKEYRVYRYNRGVKPVVVATVRVGEPAEFSDKTAGKGELCFYYVTSIDNDGRESKPSEEVSIRTR